MQTKMLKNLILEKPVFLDRNFIPFSNKDKILVYNYIDEIIHCGYIVISKNGYEIEFKTNLGSERFCIEKEPKKKISRYCISNPTQLNNKNMFYFRSYEKINK